jgi:hypothetical protein
MARSLNPTQSFITKHLTLFLKPGEIVVSFDSILLMKQDARKGRLNQMAKYSRLILPRLLKAHKSLTNIKEDRQKWMRQLNLYSKKSLKKEREAYLQNSLLQVFQ